MASNPASQSEQDSATNAVEMELKFQELSAVTRRAFLGARAHLAAWRRLLQVLDALLDTGNPVCLLAFVSCLFLSILHFEFCFVNYNSVARLVHLASRESLSMLSVHIIALRARRHPRFESRQLASRDQFRRTAGELESAQARCLEGVCSRARPPRVKLPRVKSSQVKSRQLVNMPSPSRSIAKRARDWRALYAPTREESPLATQLAPSRNLARCGRPIARAFPLLLVAPHFANTRTIHSTRSFIELLCNSRSSLTYTIVASCKSTYTSNSLPRAAPNLCL